MPRWPGMRDKPKRPKKPPVRQIKTAADKIHVREIEATERGRRVKFYRVEGYLPDGTRLRLRFKTLAEAEGELATRRVKVTNAKTELNTINTPLSADQVRDAEGALNRLKGRYTLAETVEYFLRHYAEPEDAKPLQEALSAFLDARERAGVRARSIAQLKATVKAFVTWFTLDQLPVEFASDLRLAKASVDPGKKSSPRALLAELEKRNPDFPRPAVHSVTTADIVRFLQSIRTKDGAATASRKTWNNYRADLHAFFSWTCDRQRRWIRDNPVAGVDKFKDGRGVPTCLSVKQTQALMAYVRDYEGGKVAPFFALALFAGLRTGPNGELYKLARHKDRPQLIDLKHGVIHVQPEISKTHQYRQVIIRPNLMAWLKDFTGEILPKNHDRMIKDVRAKFQLGHDVLRHTFFSMHVATFKSVGEAAIEGGNTESVVKRHYLNLAGYKDGAAFWKIGLLPGAGKKPRVR
ncbi:site-specific integrase [Luteolibacter arcticus]|uniref:Site-specific integrase n=1 Tax=Luteolibacter arcticus TaxID=1581411 RepID=A0ABT3GG94_9BACT|nr:site-specific integrase [Luteolibacter arcticus]MCW1922627.1 site-specific integrase [Luteolibacter arcticus]